MLGLYVCLASSLVDERTTRFEIPKTRVRVGTAHDNDLVLPAARTNVIAFHIELELVGGVWYLVPLVPVKLRNVWVKERTRVDDGADITVGAFKLVLELIPRGADPATDRHEREILEDIETSRDDASRLVYADWLEENGDRFRAEFLRLSQDLVGVRPRDQAVWMRNARRLRRLRELANHIDVGWRERVARPPVLGCRNRRCDMDWGQLASTADASVRHCTQCDHDVAYCDDLEEGRERLAAGLRIVLDARVERVDLVAPEWTREADDDDADTLDRR